MVESKMILFFSDPHYSINSKKNEEKWFPTICDFLEKIGWQAAVERFLSFWDNITQDAFEHMIAKAKELGPYSLVGGLGDYTPGANEEGMLTEKAHIQYYYFRRHFDKIGCLKRLLVWGDHDVGYRFDVSKKIGIKIGTEQGGISVESVHIAMELIGLPFGCFSISGIKFVFIATNLIRIADENSVEKLLKMRHMQEAFLKKILHNHKEGKLFLLLHDPTALLEETPIRKIMDAHREKITAIMHGHLHAEFSRLLTRLFSVTYRKLCGEYKTILVPAPWGMMGIGGGFLIMNINADGTYQIEKCKI